MRGAHGWAEPDAVAVKLICGFGAAAIGRAVRDGERGLAASCHALTGALARRLAQQQAEAAERAAAQVAAESDTSNAPSIWSSSAASKRSEPG